MKTYVIADISIINQEAYEGYKKLTPDTISAFGGKFIVRGSKATTLEGPWSPERIVVLEFPSRERAEAWYSSEMYAPVKKIRQAASTGSIIMIDGVDM